MGGAVFPPCYLPGTKVWWGLAQRLKRLPAMWETWVRSLGWEDPLEKEMATHSSILAWRIPVTGEPGGLLSTGSDRVRHDRNDLAAAATAADYFYEVIFFER